MRILMGPSHWRMIQTLVTELHDDAIATEQRAQHIGDADAWLIARKQRCKTAALAKLVADDNENVSTKKDYRRIACN